MIRWYTESIMSIFRKIGPASIRLLLALSLAACSAGDGSVSAEDRNQIREVLEAYVIQLADAYAENRFDSLAGLAAEKEIARVEKRIRDLAAEGWVLEPTFRQLTMENVEIWGYANAFVTTFEVWDERLFISGTRQLAREGIGRSYRVKYQLKREDDRWQILFRTIQEN